MRGKMRYKQVNTTTITVTNEKLKKIEGNTEDNRNLKIQV